MSEVLIVGGGPAGLALANVLADQNITSDIVDKLRVPQNQSRASSIQPKSFEFFRSLGLYEALIERSIPLMGNRIYLDGIQISEVSFRDPKSGETTIAIEQCTVENLLRRRLESKGISVTQQTELTSLRNNREDSVVSLSFDGKCVERDFRVVVGCDGGKSAVRHFADIRFPGTKFVERSFVSDLVLDTDLDRRYMHYLVREDMRLVIVPLPGEGQFKVSGCTSLRGEERPEDILEHAFRSHGFGSCRIAEIKDFDFYTIHARVASSFVLDNIFLCGDAAHVIPPNGGQGLSLAFEDAQILGAALARYFESGEREALRPYMERRQVVEQKMAEASRTKARYSFDKVGKSTTSTIEREQERIVAEELR
jgi:2-polyprenyl-6-methoxyphenol hydroxylase-like FAD-dependent oxidoreductase